MSLANFGSVQETLTEIANGLGRVEAKLDAIAGNILSKVVNIPELERILGLKPGTSRTTRYRLLHKLGITSMSHGRYIRRDVEHAIVLARFKREQAKARPAG